MAGSAKPRASGAPRGPIQTGSALWARFVLCAPLLAAASTGTARAQGVPDDLLVIKAGRVITVSGEELSPGLIVIEDGKITGTGKSIEYPPSARVIDARHETVMPGFVHPRSRHDLASYRRTGVHGDRKASAEVYLTRLRFDDLLEAGYTAVCFVPDGVDLPGVAAVYRTAGPDDQRLLLENAYLRAAPEWSGRGKKNLRDALKKAREEIEKVEKAREEWEKKQKEKAEKAKEEDEKKGEDEEESPATAKASAPPGQAKAPPEQVPDEKQPAEDKFEPPPIDPRYQPLVDLIQKKDGARIMVELSRASDLRHLDDVLKPYEDIVPAYYLAAGVRSDYHHVVDELGEREAQVALLPRIHYLPETTFRYNLMNELTRAGARVSASPAWAADREDYLRIRERLAELVRAGLSREAAIASLTQRPAAVLGLDKRLGTVEKDKEADLVFLDGDPLDPHTRVTRVMILGEFVWKADSPEGEPRS